VGTSVSASVKAVQNCSLSTEVQTAVANVNTPLRLLVKIPPTWQVSRFLPDLLCDLLQVEQCAAAAGAAHILRLHIAHAGALQHTNRLQQHK
jgi:hypothetical protein